ncbi:MAG TPA: hypothetical protein VHQ01_07435, partial [Pyrinomonadaceae bacterium]|nr:hypothetical protein [Pyrinomonadaceae bacterium]
RSLMHFDVWANDRQRIKLGEPNPYCKTCGQRIFEFLDAEARGFEAVLCGRDAVQIAPPKPVDLDLVGLAERLNGVAEVKQNEYLVRFTSGENEITVFRDGRAIVKGTDDVTAARSLYAKYIGS